MNPHSLIDIEFIEQPPDRYLVAIGEVFARFDQQDSGNISYGVRVGEERFFVKSAGRPDDPRPYLTHAQRIALLRNAARLWHTTSHPALPTLQHVIESPEGPLLVYAWVEGELIGARSAHRADPASAFQRFRGLPAPEILAALDVIYELHAELARAGWVASDFYDGCLIYDFAQRRLHVMDLDTYHAGPTVNTMGRMFGSTRFMAPEEFELGAPIDQCTNCYTMGRTALVLLGDGDLNPATFRGGDALYAVVARACQAQREQRYGSLAAFTAAWCAERDTVRG